jgi:HlyD family secretion protein
VDGVVISRTVSEGQTVQASFQAPELFKIAEDLTNMQIDINLSEADISAVKEGMAATFTVDAFPGRTFPATLTKLKLNPTNSNGVVTYQAVLSLENTDKLLIPGMTAYVSLLIEERKNVLTAPNAAFRYKPTDALQETDMPVTTEAVAEAVPLYVLKGGVPQRIKVVVGINDNRKSEITGGELQEGDDIILREERFDEEEG